MKHSIFAIIAAVSADLALAAPVVQSCQMTQGPGNRIVTINYVLSEYPAVVTLDVQTNCTENAVDKWVSIGGEHIWNAQGAVWRKVTSADLADGKFTITWDPTQSWTDETGKGFVVDGVTRKARAVVTAWPLDNTPDYMVVDVSSGAKPNTQRYYQAKEFLPGSVPGQTGAVTNNTAYKTSMLVMRKIMAKDVTWTMGSNQSEVGRDTLAIREGTHQVTLTNNYYIAIFETTQAQFANIATNSVAITDNTNKFVGDMRPMCPVSRSEIRNAHRTAKPTVYLDSTENWPSAPTSDSFLGLLNLKSGLDFDLPSDAEWEFACRAGHGSGYWGDGSAVTDATTDANLSRLGRYKRNNPGGGTATYSFSPEQGGTAIVGSYLPNSWGIYDMHGNVSEWVLDHSLNNAAEWDIATAVDTDGVPYGGRVNINPANPTLTLSGTTSTRTIFRGGAWSHEAYICRSSFRNGQARSVCQYDTFGFRVVCRAGLK